MAGGAAAVGSLNLFRDVTTKAPSAGLESGLPLRLCSVPYPGRGGCFHRDGRRLSKAQGPPLVRRRAALLAVAQDHDDVDIVKIKRLSDGSQLFTFGPSTDGSPEPALTATTAQAEQSRPRSSSFTKRSSVPKRPPRTKIVESKPVEEPPPEPSQPHRQPSSFVRRSPIPHSSTRTPASETPVAVSPTVTAAHGAKSKPSAGAPLTGVRERTEAPVPTQDRLRPKSQFSRRSPVTGGRKLRAAVPSSDQKASTDDEPKALSRPPSAFSKRSPVLRKSPRRLEAEKAEPALVPNAVSRPPSSFKKASLVAGRPVRKVPEAVLSEETAEADGAARPKRAKSAFKKASPVAGRPARKVPDSSSSEKGTAEKDGAARPKRAASAFKRASPVAGRPARKVPESFLSEKETAEEDGAARPKRAATAFKRASPVAGRPARKVPEPSMKETAEEDGAAPPKRAASAFKRASPITAKGRGARKPGPRVIQDLTGIVTNGVAKAAVAVEKTVEKFVDDVVGNGPGVSDMEEEGEAASGESDLQNMKLADLRLLAKERKIKGRGTMKKWELIEALEVSFSENV